MLPTVSPDNLSLWFAFQPGRLVMEIKINPGAGQGYAPIRVNDTQIFECFIFPYVCDWIQTSFSSFINHVSNIHRIHSPFSDKIIVIPDDVTYVVAFRLQVSLKAANRSASHNMHNRDDQVNEFQFYRHYNKCQLFFLKKNSVIFVLGKVVFGF